MIADFYLGQGDLLPSISAILRDENDAPMDLVALGYDLTFPFRMRLQDKLRPAITGSAVVVVGGAVGEVRYDLLAGNTDVPGLYDIEWITSKAGKPETFGNNNKSTLWIEPRV